MRRVEELRPRARSIAADMEAAGPPADLVDGFALRLPVPVAVAVLAICELLGVPVADHPKFRVWSDNVLRLTGDVTGKTETLVRGPATLPAGW